MYRSQLTANRLLAALLGTGLVLLTVRPVLAHAELARSDPAPNVSVVVAPEVLRITFTEAIDPSAAFLDLVDSQDRRVAGLGALETLPDGVTMEASLPHLEPGVYTVLYQVVSTIDGHATAGRYAFLVDPTGAAPPPADSAQSSSPSVDLPTLAARWVGLAALLVALGGLLLWWGAGLRRAAPPWVLTGLASAISVAGVAGYLLLSARPIAAALGQGGGTGIPFDVAGSFGWTGFAVAMRLGIGCAIVAAAACGVAARRRLESRAVALGGTVLLGVSLGCMSLAGHAAASGGIGFAALDWLHLLAVSAWLGALPAALLLAMRSGHPRTALVDLLRRHGRVSMVAAPIVALTGIANSPLVLGRARDLVASDYGNLLLAKATLLSVALGIGAVNHLALRGRGRAAVAALVGAELLVAAVAVSVAATMVTIQPASVRQERLAAQPVSPAHFFGEAGPSRIHVAVSLPTPGIQSFRVTVTDRSTGAPRADVQKVFLSFDPPPDSGLTSERVELAADPVPGLWTTSGAYTPLAGAWGMEVGVRRQGARDESLSFEVPITDPGAAELGPPPDTGIGVPGPLAATWSLLPTGVLGWLPAAAALLALAVSWPLRRRRFGAAVRGAALGLLIVSGAAVVSRTVVEAANVPTPRELGRQPAPAEPDLDRGRAVYLANCASCHGRDGDGDGAVATLPLAGPLDVGDASDAELSYRIAYGIAGTPMPSFAGLLTADERSDLIGYLRDQFND